MSVHSLQVFRGPDLISQFEINELTEFTKTLMGDHYINCQVTLSSPLPLQLGDYIIHKNRVFKINTLPELFKNDVGYQYNITFEPEIYSLYNKLYLHLGDVDFTYFGTLSAFSDLIISNINSSESGWSLGEIDNISEKEITFSSDTCRTALTKISEAFGVEYDVDGKVITIKKTIGRQRDIIFKVGIYKGLYSLKRTAISDKKVVTIVYGFGGGKNIDYNYRDGAKKIVFNAKQLSKNVSLYGKREGVYINEDIYPHRTGIISSVSNRIQFIDSSIDFNINTYLQEGIPAKILFTSGSLSGVTFEMESYNSFTKMITLKEFKDTNNYILPSATRQAQIGDQYVVNDINMPQSYIDKAESELQNATQTFLNENSNPQAAYELVNDEKYIRENNIVLESGDFVKVQESEIAIDGYLRISTISYPLVNEEAIKATISNYIIDSSQGRLAAAVLNNRNDIRQVYTGNILEARRQTANLVDLKDRVFDPVDGKLDATNFRAGSIEMLYLANGSKANDFNISEVIIKANLLGNPNDIQITDGRLLHNQIEITGLGFIWVMSGITQTGLNASTSYYVYAKCSKNALTGTFVISQNKIKLDDVPGYFHFTMGDLYPVKDGRRDFSFTKGMTYIVGDTITSGLLKSIDAQTYWDMTNGKFKLGNDNFGLDWNVTTPNTLTIRGAVVQSPGGATAPINIFRGAYVPGTTYFKGESVQFNGSTWNYINATATNNQPPVENTYWTASAKKGNDGTSVNIKGTVTSSTNLPTSGNTIGDGYIANDTKHLWMWTGAAWNDLGNLSGPKGDAGAPGKPTRTYFAKNNSYDISPAFSQVFEPSGWSSIAPVTDDYIYLGDNLGNIVTDNDGNYITVGTDPEYLWVIVENLDASGNWVSWSLPNRLTGRPASDGDFTEVRFAKNGSPTVPPSINTNESDPSGWTITPPAFGTLEYLWKVYGNKFGDTKLLIGQWAGPYRETALDGKNGTDGLNGTNGTNGSQGPSGPLPTGGDVYNAAKSYTGSTLRVDIVRYNDGSGEKAYVARTDAGTFSGILPTNTGKWNAFGGQYESVATKLFFAELARVVNLMVDNLITATTGIKRVEITGSENNIRLMNKDDQVLILIDDDSSQEGTYVSEQPPSVPPGNNYLGQFMQSGVIKYRYATMGPGIAVGVSRADNNGYSSVGRKEIYTNGTITAGGTDLSNQSYMNQNGINSNGTLTVKGETILNQKTTLGGEVQVFDGTNYYTAKTAIQNIGGGYGMKYVNGIYVGTVAI